MPSSNVEKIKERLDIVQIIGSYIKLEKAGSNLKARCPFHNEKTPSFFVSPSRGGYYCFGCGAKGDIFNFVENFEGLDFKGALKILAERAGVTLERENPKEYDQKSRLLAVVEEATKYFAENLKKEPAPLEYLKKRGLSDKTIKDWQIGYAKNDWRDLYDHLLSADFKKEEMEAVGLVKRSEKNTEGGEERWFDFFRGRVMFPLRDSAGRTIAFSGRIMPAFDDGKAGKYINSKESELFSKSKVLYGYDKAKNDIRIRDYAILVEGQMDLIMCHQAGFTNTVASSGTALTADQLQILKRMSNNLIMSYDADNAGFRASERAFRMALGLEMVVKVVTIEGGKDPADLILKDPDLWKLAVKDSKHVIDFFIDTLLAKKLSGRNLAEDVRLRVLPFVAAIESSTERANFIRSIAYKLGIREQVIEEDLKKVKNDDALSEVKNLSYLNKPKEEKNKLRKSAIEKKLLGLVYSLEEKEKPEADPKVLRAKIGEIVSSEYLKTLEDSLKDKKNELLFEAESFYQDSDKLTEEIEEMLLGLDEDITKERFVETMDMLHIAEKNKDKAKISELLQKCHDISTKLTQLSKKKK